MPGTLFLTVNLLAMTNLLKVLPRDQIFRFHLFNGFVLRGRIIEVLKAIVRIFDDENNIENVDITDIIAVEVEMLGALLPLTDAEVKCIPRDFFILPGALGIERIAERLIGRRVNIYTVSSTSAIIDTRITNVFPGLIFTNRFAVASNHIQAIEELLEVPPPNGA